MSSEGGGGRAPPNPRTRSGSGGGGRGGRGGGHAGVGASSSSSNRGRNRGGGRGRGGGGADRSRGAGGDRSPHHHRHHRGSSPSGGGGRRNVDRDSRISPGGSGRGRGGRRRGSGGRGGRRGGRGEQGGSGGVGVASMRDEEVLIAFAPHLRSSNPEAVQIHNRYQSGVVDGSDGDNQAAFVEAARGFLVSVEARKGGEQPQRKDKVDETEQQGGQERKSREENDGGVEADAEVPKTKTGPAILADEGAPSSMGESVSTEPGKKDGDASLALGAAEGAAPASASASPMDFDTGPHAGFDVAQGVPLRGEEEKMPISASQPSPVSPPPPPPGLLGSSVPSGGVVVGSTVNLGMQRMSLGEQTRTGDRRPAQSPVPPVVQTQSEGEAFPGRQAHTTPTAPFSSMPPPSTTSAPAPTQTTHPPPGIQPRAYTPPRETAHPGQQHPAPLSPYAEANEPPLQTAPVPRRTPPPPPPSGWVPCPPGLPQQQHPQAHPSETAASPGGGVARSIVDETTSQKTDGNENKNDATTTAGVARVKKEWQPKRTHARPNLQPGRIFANGMPLSPQNDVLTLRPRQELKAKWILPLGYLRERAIRNAREEAEKAGSDATTPPANLTVRDALKSLSVGLFRRGCSENGSNASIISKEIVPSPIPDDGNENEQQQQRPEYPFEIDSQTDSIYGIVPFYAPRTPGNVVLRLYFENDPVVTLATGPCVQIRIAEQDVEPTLRFVLSNFKSKKGTTSVASLHSLCSVLDQFSPSNDGPPPGVTGGSSPSHYSNNRHHHHRRDGQQQQQRSTWYDGAGRAAWGCICESRKVVELCASEYLKGRDRYDRLEEEAKQQHQQQQQQQESEEEGSGALKPTPGTAGTTEISETKEQDVVGGGDATKVALTTETQFREKMNSIMGGRASNERKWRDVQSAFASILRSVLSNSSSPLLLKRDLINKLRLEYELWCPLCETFAPNPFHRKSEEGGDGGDDNTNGAEMSMPGDISNFPHPITSEHYRLARQSRTKMQTETLGFVPRTESLQQVLFPSTRGGRTKSPAGKGRNSASSTPSSSTSSAAHELFDKLSTAMHELYDDEYMVTAEIHQKRESVRMRTEKIVSQCDAFPRGTRVVVFGSSANGFGSPNSDLDMCLQLPPSTSLADEEDKSGSSAMAKLSEQLELGGMKNVDTARLTARIPVVMFNFPDTMPRKKAKQKNDKNSGEQQNGSGDDDDDDDTKPLIECDLSMQNPLACLNTSLLLTYSSINPTARILASIIKRWAKNRDINNPSHHTLSSYGYILMLLHFLTHHSATSNGLVVAPESESRQQHPQHHGTRGQQQHAQQPPIPSSASSAPFLPNLQWMDLTWPQGPPKAPYREVPVQPRSLIPHPSEPNFVVNTYFYRLNDHATMTNLQRRFPATGTPSVGILLASFFHYYAFEFDYKKYVVSLNSTITNHGIVEREIKAEHDCWKLYGPQTLSIEDPFETFYDVAHVLKSSNFVRIRREFAEAYTKIVDAAVSAGKKKDSGIGGSNMSGKDLIDLVCAPVVS